MTGGRRKVVLFIASSLDGYIAGTDGDISWLFSDQDYGYKELLGRTDTIVMGRKTYDQLLGMGDYPYRGMECYVFSRSAMGGDENAEFVNGPVDELVQGLLTKDGKDIWLVGGSELVYHFMMADLVDEFVISVHPIVLGQGIPLFKAGTPTCRLRLVEARSFSSGLVQSSYVRER